MSHDHAGENGFANFESTIFIPIFGYLKCLDPLRQQRFAPEQILRKPLAIGLCLLATVAIFAAIGMTLSIHHIDEGFVGVYYRVRNLK